MVNLHRRVLGAKALIILKYKVSRTGIDLHPNEFTQYVTKNAQRIGCPREELLGFFNKFLVPVILHSCNLTKSPSPELEPNKREGEIAFRLLKMGFFWDLRGLRDEIYRIVEKTSLEFKEVAAIVTYIVNEHLLDQFGEGEAIKLYIIEDGPMGTNPEGEI